MKVKPEEVSGPFFIYLLFYAKHWSSQSEKQHTKLEWPYNEGKKIKKSIYLWVFKKNSYKAETFIFNFDNNNEKIIWPSLIVMTFFQPSEDGDMEKKTKHTLENNTMT